MLINPPARESSSSGQRERVHHTIVDYDLLPTAGTVFSGGQESELSQEEGEALVARALEELDIWEEFRGVPDTPDNGTVNTESHGVDEFPHLSQQQADSGPEPSAADIQARVFGVQAQSHWYPFETKTVSCCPDDSRKPDQPLFQMFLLSLFMNMPRLRISEAHLKMMLWIMKEIGGRDVPSIKAVKTAQQRLQSRCEIKTHQYMSDLGNVFHMNDLGDLLGQVSLLPCNACHDGDSSLAN